MNEQYEALSYQHFFEPHNKLCIQYITPDKSSIAYFDVLLHFLHYTFLFYFWLSFISVDRSNHLAET